MRTRWLVLAGCLVAAISAAMPAGATDALAEALTETEARWLRAGMPVLRYAREQGLPVDVIVQPSDQPDASPIALGIQDGRCKLVVSMRGSPAADAFSASIAPALFNAAAEATFAHELGHCWRHFRGAPEAAQAAFAPVAADKGTEAGSGARIAALREEMRAARLEEGFADLVALAWTRRTHPDQYAQIHQWMTGLRGDLIVAGEHHDTGAWIRLARDGSAFGGEGDVFRQALPLWEEGQKAGQQADQRAPD